jgi:hypothetical protein
MLSPTLTLSSCPFHLSPTLSSCPFHLQSYHCIRSPFVAVARSVQPLFVRYALFSSCCSVCSPLFSRSCSVQPPFVSAAVVQLFAISSPMPSEKLPQHSQADLSTTTSTTTTTLPPLLFPLPPPYPLNIPCATCCTAVTLVRARCSLNPVIGSIRCGRFFFGP